MSLMEMYVLREQCDCVAEISPLRRRGGGFAVAPSTPSQCTPMFLELLCYLENEKYTNEKTSD